MKSGITIDGTFIGVTGHSVDVYFQVVRNIIDSGKTARLMLPSESGLVNILITPTTTLRSFFAAEEMPEELRDTLVKAPYGNFPGLVLEYLDPDDRHWAQIKKTSLGEAIVAFADAESAATASA